MSRWIVCPSCGGKPGQRREEEWDDALAAALIANGKAATLIAEQAARLIAAGVTLAPTPPDALHHHDVNGVALWFDASGKCVGGPADD